MATKKAPQHVKLMNVPKERQDKVQELMEVYDHNTGTSAVEMAIDKFHQTHEAMKDSWAQNDALRARVQELETTISNYLLSVNNLTHAVQ